MDALTWKEVLVTFLLPLIIGSYFYAWYGAGKLWDALERRTDKLREEFRADLENVKDNDIRHLEERVERLEQR